MISKNDEGILLQRERVVLVARCEDPDFQVTELFSCQRCCCSRALRTTPNRRRPLLVARRDTQMAAALEDANERLDLLSVDVLLHRLKASYSIILGSDVGQQVPLSFVAISKAVFTMVQAGAALQVYNMTVRVLNESLPHEIYRDGRIWASRCSMIKDCLLFMERGHLLPGPSIVQVSADLLARRADIMRERARDHFRRLKPKALRVGRLALFVRRVHDEVIHRPGGSGQKRTREEFESALNALASGP